MKVLYITNMYPTRKNKFYGIFVKEQIESLRKLGVDIGLVFINGKESKLNYLFAIQRIANTLNKKKFDLVHVHHSYCLFPLYIAFLKTGKRLPVVFTFQESEFLKPKNFISFVPSLSLLGYSRFIKNIALNLSDYVITVWEGLMKHMKTRVPYDVIPCGVDLNRFKVIDRHQARKFIHLPLDKKIIFFPGNTSNPIVAKEKGFDVFLQAFEYIRRAVGDNVIYIKGGGIDPNLMPYYMNASDVVVQTSWFEASPMIIKEALAVGTPIVSTDVGDTKKWINGIEGCFLVTHEPKDIAHKIMQVLKRDSRTDGRNYVHKYSLDLESVAKKILKVYEKTLQKYKNRYS